MKITAYRDASTFGLLQRQTPLHFLQEKIPMLRDELIRQMPTGVFNAYMSIAQQDDHQVAIVMSLIFNERKANKDFITRFRDLLEIEASDVLQRALESHDF